MTYLYFDQIRSNEMLSYSLTNIPADPRLTSGGIREQPEYIRNHAGNIREHPAFDPGWNKIFNITMIREV
jgi:hypothetical protein